LEKDQNKLEEERKEAHIKLEDRIVGLEKTTHMLTRAMKSALRDLVASFVKEMLKLNGVPEEKIKVLTNVNIIHNGTIREIDIFNSDPVVVGQVIIYISSIEEAKNELNKLLEDVNFVEKMTGRKVFMAILAVRNASEEVAKFLETECKKLNVKLIMGRLISKY
jgi:CO dehydrogenase/acetyl-CoA synthase gamma subunit (corrinoid Fe-S protein)